MFGKILSTVAQHILLNRNESARKWRVAKCPTDYLVILGISSHFEKEMVGTKQQREVVEYNGVTIVALVGRGKSRILKELLKLSRLQNEGSMPKGWHDSIEIKKAGSRH